MDALARFELASVLNQNGETKSIVLLGTIDSARALLLLERRPLDSNDARQLDTAKKPCNANDVYVWFKARTCRRDVKGMLIWPASEAHVAKYSVQKYAMVAETPQQFNTVVAPWIGSLDPERTRWVDNILAGISEREHVLYRHDDPESGFVLLPDSKWDQGSLATLYCIAIVQRTDLRSLRDVRLQHTAMLRQLADQSTHAIAQRYGVPRDQLRLFFHYPPSYYHLHVHIVHINNSGFKGQSVGQAHLLESVIDNIETICGDYYAKCTLNFALGTNHPLFDKLGALAATSQPAAAQD